MGYTFFNVNALTYSELNALVDAYNRRTIEQNKNNKK